MTTLLKQLPLPPVDKKGWPWTEESPVLPPFMPNGKSWPKISIVTPSFNQGQFIEETIRSILLQNYPNLEYIIIDGGSNDNTIKLIKKYEPWLTYWVSEKDRGQSNAINKGFNQCSGDIIAWLNSDDLFKKSTLKYVATNLSLDTPGWLVGASHLVDYKSNFLKLKSPPDKINKETFLCWFDNWFSQQSTFWNRKIFDIVGYLDESLHYVMDVDFWWRINIHKEPLIVKEVLSEYRLHNKAKTIYLREKSNSELISWSYQKFICQSNEGYANFIFIFNRLLELQIVMDRLKHHSIIGKVIRFWGSYINPCFNKI